MEYEKPIKGIEIAWVGKGGGTCVLPTVRLSREISKTLKEYPLEYLESVSRIEIRLPEDLEAWYNTK